MNKFKRLERVGIKHPSDFGKITKVLPNGKYQVIPEGSNQRWVVSEDNLEKLR